MVCQTIKTKNMDAIEIHDALQEQILYLPITNDFMEDILKSISECKVEILETHEFSNKLTILKIKVPHLYYVFQLGAFVQLERQCAEQRQKGIDGIFKDLNQLS